MKWFESQLEAKPFSKTWHLLGEKKTLCGLSLTDTFTGNRSDAPTGWRCRRCLKKLEKHELRNRTQVSGRPVEAS